MGDYRVTLIKIPDSKIPDLDADKINSGTFPESRVPAVGYLDYIGPPANAPTQNGEILIDTAGTLWISVAIQQAVTSNNAITAVTVAPFTNSGTWNRWQGFYAEGQQNLLATRGDFHFDIQNLVFHSRQQPSPSVNVAASWDQCLAEIKAAGGTVPSDFDGAVFVGVFRSDKEALRAFEGRTERSYEEVCVRTVWRGTNRGS